jgi:hypothetical protein
MTLASIRSALCTVLAVGLLAGFAPAAVAQDVTQQGYSGPGGTEQVEVAPAEQGETTGTSRGSGDTPGSSGSPASTSGSRQGSGGFLPFTGLDIGFLLAAGGMLLLIGTGLRRLSRQGRQVT